MKYKDLELGKTYRIDDQTTGVFTEINGERGFTNVGTDYSLYIVSDNGLVQFWEDDEGFEEIVNEQDNTNDTTK
jgi:hypothetical protein